MKVCFFWLYGNHHPHHHQGKRKARQNRAEMKKVVCFLCFSLQLLIWASFSASRTSPPPPPHHHHRSSGNAGEKTEFPDAAAAVTDSKIGSSPPRCADKCYGCTPCEPVEVPAITNSGSGWGQRRHRGHGRSSRGGGGSGIHVQYTIYEPEGWKCKCGPSLYSP